MVKILKKSKKPISAHPKVNAVILAIQDAPDHDLPGILDAVHYWHWPRTDLHYWIKPLNRFDSILEEICKSYHVTDNNVQTNEFTPRTKELILSILRFTRLLLENATNRKLYASFDRMNDLLLTQDPDILENALRLVFRRAQQIAANGPASSGDAFNLTPKRVLDLTYGWKSVRQAGISMYDLVKDSIDTSAVQSIQEVSFQFYRKASASAGPAVAKESESTGEAVAMTPAATPAPKNVIKPSKSMSIGPSTPHSANHQGKGQNESIEQEGMTTITLGNVAHSGKSATDLLIDAMELYRVPMDQKIRLLQRIRVALGIDNSEKRRQLLRVRLLAICVLIHTHADQVVDAEIFLHEPDFIQQLADLVQPNKAVPMDVRTVALLALDTCCRVGTRVNDVTAALSVSVNHGTLMSILRKLAVDLQSDHPETTSEYVDALFTFLTYLQTAVAAGNMLQGAGVVPLLVDLVKETKLSHDALLVANRAVTFLDNFTYSFPNASGPFATAGGLQVFVQRVQQLVTSGVSAAEEQASQVKKDVNSLVHAGDPGTLSYGETTLLKSLFRCLQRLMNSGQNTEGVRQLIDSSLVESCKLVMQHRDAFGPQNLALAVTIMLTFVHNEPTSLTVLQENKVPDVFYDTIKGEVEPSLDVLSVIPTAIGALCLNEAGLKQFTDQCSDVFNKYFGTFLSEKHARILNERENAVIIGANFDELVRHHPSLKPAVLDAITKLLRDLYEQGKDYSPEHAETYRLVQVKSGASVGAATTTPPVGTNQASIGESVGDSMMSGQSTEVADSTLDAESKRDDNRMLASVAVVGRFLEGFFTTPSHCKDYIKKDGLDHLLRLFTLPCIPFDVHHHSPYPGLTTVFLTISEHSPDHLLKALLSHAKETLAAMEDFWQPNDPTEHPMNIEKLETLLTTMLEPQTAETLETSNKLFRTLVNAQHILVVMSELHSTDAYVTRQPSSQILNLLRTPEKMKTLQDLCSLHRACTFLSVKLKSIKSEASQSVPATKPGSQTSNAAPGPGTSGSPPDSDSKSVPNANDVDMAVATESKEPADTGVHWPEAKLSNSKALNTVFVTIPDSLRSFLQGIMGLHATRRSSIDNQQRKDATFVSHAIAIGIAQSLRWPSSSTSSVDFEYATLMVKFMVDLLHVERSTTGGLHLLFLKSLDKQQGIDRLISLHGKYVEQISELSKIPEPDRDAASKMRLIHAVGGLKVILSVFEILTSHRFLLSAGHLLLLTQDRSSQSYFDPYAFLVKLRCRLLSPVMITWDSDFLTQSPPIIVRAVFRILLQILEAQGESNEIEAAATSTFPIPVRPQVVASPALVQSLVEMGFPRSACEQALVRRNNNLATAADYLMSHPELVAAARAREEQEAAGTTEPATQALPAQGDESALGESTTGRVSPGDVDMTDMASGRNTPLPQSISDETNILDAVPATNKASSSSKKYTKADLDAQRETLKKNFVNRALDLAQDHGELVFDIRAALKIINFGSEVTNISETSKGLEAILNSLTDRVIDHIPENPKEERDVAARLRLLALMFSDPFFRKGVESSYVAAMKPVSVLMQEYNRHNYAADARPKWLSSAMLLGELVIVRSTLPMDVKGPTSASQNADEQGADSRILLGPDFADEREALFEVSLDVLRKGISDRDLLQSTLRLLLILTRNHEVARRFLDQGGLRTLLQGCQQGRKDIDGYQEFAIMILRNAIEDPATVKHIMESRVQYVISRTLSKNAVDATVFVKDLNPEACRDTPLFIEVAGTLCKLVGKGEAHGIAMRRPKVDETSTKNAESASDAKASDVKTGDEQQQVISTGMQIDDLSKALPSSTPMSLSAETVMHFLITEAVAATTAALKPSNEGAVSSLSPISSVPIGLVEAELQQSVDTGQAAASDGPNNDGTGGSSTVSAKNEGPPAVPQSLKDYIYATFLLGCISELVASYTTCKLSLLSWNKRKLEGHPSGIKGSKSRSSFMSHLLNNVIPTGSPSVGKEHYARKRFALSNKATTIVVSLCSDQNRNPFEPNSGPSNELTSIRKTVLDNIARSFKDIETTQEHVDAKYGRLSALCGLCSRLLAPPGPPGSNTIDRADKSQNELALHIAKLMLEKNYASILTSALGDVDFNHPDALTLIDTILLPLENLTNLVTKIGRSAGPDATPEALAPGPVAVPLPASADLSSDDESGSEDMEVDEEGEQENEEDEHDRAASDVYRNSALGMFQGELEPANAEEQYSSEEEMDQDMEEWDDGGDDMMDEEGAVPSDVSDESENDEDELMDIEQDDIEEEIDDDEDDDEEGSSDPEDQDDSDDQNEGDDHDHLNDGLMGNIQADIAAALRNGHLEPVDDFTARLVNEQMDMFGDGRDAEAAFIDDHRLHDGEDGNLEEGDAPEDDDEDDEDDDLEVDDEDDILQDGHPAGIFEELLGERPPGPRDPNLHVSVVGGPPGAADRILSIEFGGNAPPTLSRRAPRPAQTERLGQHSLLTDNTEVVRRGGRHDFMGGSRHRHRSGRHGSEYSEWVQSIEDMIGTGAGQLLEQVFGNMAHTGGAVPLPTLAPRGVVDARGPGELLQNLLAGLHGRPGGASRHRHVHGSDQRPNQTNLEAQLVNEALSIPPLTPPSTVDRWTDESAIFSGGLPANERIAIITRRLAETLRPERDQQEREDREKDEKEKAAREQELKEHEEKEAAAERSRKEAEEKEAATKAEDSDMSSINASAEAGSSAIPTLPATTVDAPQTPASSLAGTSERLSWRERIERRRQAQAAQQNNTTAQEELPTPSGDANAPTSARDELAEVLNLAARLSAVDSTAYSSTAEAAPSSSGQADVNMTQEVEPEPNEHNPPPSEPQEQALNTSSAAPEAEPSTTSDRVTIQIRGNTVDITDTGIDPTFLEALPDDMREEVLNQHFRETRAAAAPTNQEIPSSINSEFLDALPPELRAEVLAQEAIEAARHRPPPVAAATAPPGDEDNAQHPEEADNAAPMELEMDPVAFLASLDPQLRQTVLLEQGEEMLGALPPEMLEEYRALRTREMRGHGFRRHHLGRRAEMDPFRTVGPNGSTRRIAPIAPKRDAVQLLEKPGVAALVRLLFFPSPMKKNSLASILKHLCENGKTRIEIINLLLSILHEGTRESGAGGEVVDRTITNLTAPGYIPSSANKAHKNVQKGKPSVPPSTPGSHLAPSGSTSFPGLPHHLVSSGPGDNIPNIAVQRSLETLSYLVATNESSATFFLTEQDLPINLVGTKKGPLTGKRDKGKGRASEASQQREKVYPVIVLFALLDRKSLNGSPAIMEALTKLLANITVPLRHLEQHKDSAHVPSEILAAATPNTGVAITSESAQGNNIASGSVQPPVASVSTSESKPSVEGEIDPADPNVLSKPPRLPALYLKKVVNVLDLGECSSKMFSAALALIHNLWLVPDARETIAGELVLLAQKYGSQLLGELDQLGAGLSPQPADTAMDSQMDDVEALSRFSQASSNQTKLLRVLKTIEYAKQQQMRALKKRKNFTEARRLEIEANANTGWEEVLKELEKAAPVEILEGGEAATAMDTGDKDKMKKEAERIAKERELSKITTELETIKAQEVAEQYKVEELYDGFDFSPVWTKLSDCLSAMEQAQDVASNAATLLPLIEAFLLVSSWGLEGVDMNAVYSDTTPNLTSTQQAQQGLSPPTAQAVTT